MKTGWLCAGAGAFGIIQAGMLKALHELGETYDYLFGCSVGALNAAFVHQDDWEVMEKVWLNISNSQVRRWAPWNLARPSKLSMYDTAPLRRLLQGYIDPIKLARNPTPFQFAVTDLSARANVLFNPKNRVPWIVDLLMASASPSLAFPIIKPENIREGKPQLQHYLADGGWVDDYGIDDGYLENLDRLILLMPHTTNDYELPTNIVHLIEILITTATWNQFVSSTKLIASKGIELIIIKPDNPIGGIKLLDFDYKTPREDLIMVGYKLAMQTMAKYKSKGA